MVKVHKTISLSVKVAAEVSKRVRRGFNFSHWVEKEYVKQFLNKDVLIKEINKLKDKISKLEHELHELEQSEIDYSMGFTDEEKRFLIDVDMKVKRGYDIKAFLKIFNRNFQRELDMDDFVMAINYFVSKLK